MAAHRQLPAAVLATALLAIALGDNRTNLTNQTNCTEDPEVDLCDGIPPDFRGNWSIDVDLDLYDGPPLSLPSSCANDVELDLCDGVTRAPTPAQTAAPTPAPGTTPAPGSEDEVLSSAGRLVPGSLVVVLAVQASLPNLKQSKSTV
mmetsp:Transcript_8652/g.26955  ORF Transcript_8652/g.26955 Transcript_8652/m.26955 type:complete len:147 (-) Transcript_8652:159-599(-)